MSLLGKSRPDRTRKTARAAFIAALLIAVMQILSLAAAAAEVYTDGYFYFIEEDGGITITGYFGKEETVTVPAFIAGVPVSKIAEGAFINTTVKTLYLPETIMTVEQGAVAAGIRVIFAEAGESPTAAEYKTEPVTEPASTETETEAPGTSGFEVRTEDATLDERVVDLETDADTETDTTPAKTQPVRDGHTPLIIGCSAAVVLAAAAAVVVINKKNNKHKGENKQ